MFDSAVQGRRLHDALQTFGADGQKLSNEYNLATSADSADRFRARIEQTQVSVNGETANLDDDKGLNWKFRRDDGRWKVDVTPDSYTPQELATNIDSHTRVARAREAVADEIRAGTIKSAPDARAALKTKSMPPLRPSTRPSTRRGSPTTRRSTTTRPTAS
jgi:hypothetical protein